MSAGYCITITEGEIVHRAHAALLKIGLKGTVSRSKTGELTICVQLAPVPGLLQHGYEISETSFGIIFKIISYSLTGKGIVGTRMLFFQTGDIQSQGRQNQPAQQYLYSVSYKIFHQTIITIC